MWHFFGVPSLAMIVFGANMATGEGSSLLDEVYKPQLSAVGCSDLK